MVYVKEIQAQSVKLKNLKLCCTKGIHINAVLSIYSFTV